ncbi:acetyl-CoA carboxylase carboxyltransferase subunit beta [Limosilactobacillus fermentum]|uniref:acetyl-CoA carboxylase carboxyltransferase subunit beta n=1 Tax=Limosilactobacillus fermentum TaxID=1613 RepID=UPI002F266D03
MKLYKAKNTLSERHVQADRTADAKVPDDLWRTCPKCQRTLFSAQMDEYATCPGCGYGFRISANQRLSWLVDSAVPMDTALQTQDPLNFPGYEGKLKKAQEKSGLNDSVWTGRARIGDVDFNLGIMDPTFIMGSLGTITGEKITRLFEDATKNQRPVVLFTASGGARMQEGIMSLMQMAKVSMAIAEHDAAGLLYIVVLTDPTTGGVTASFAMEGDVILAEPRALVGFAGRRVIEQTTHTEIPAYLQDAENVLKHGFIDHIVTRQDEKTTLAWLMKYGGKQND